MMDDVVNTTQNNGGKMEGGITGKGFRKGFDERRWLRGRPRVPKDTQKLFSHLLWEVLSEEIENKATGEKIDRLRAMLRSMTTGQMAGRIEILNRVLGKVPQAVNLAGADGKPLLSDVIGVKLIDYRTGIAETTSRPGGDSDAPCQDENLGDGSQVG